MNMKRIPRGIRNNNPGNIRISKSAWKGKVPVHQNTDRAFEQFETMEHGIRALMKLLANYMRSYGLNTVRAVINRWAPPNENNTGAYVNVVAKRVGISADERIIPDRATLTKLAEAICVHENGGSYLTSDQINRAFDML